MAHLDFNSLSSQALKLDLYWTSLGCTRIAPSDQKVGAATFHPEMLRLVVGPTSCKLCYFQPTYRPFDSSYGLSYSLQRYFQYQVVIKPFYGSAVQMYLNSLKCLGYTPSVFKLVLKESNWESSSLCAWGTGWECLLNSLEVSQITNFKQICGLKCSVPVLEIAYGLERLGCVLTSSRLQASASELGFNWCSLNFPCVRSMFALFSVLEQKLVAMWSTFFWGVFYPSYDVFLCLVNLYNQLVASPMLKRSVLRLFLIRLQRMVKLVALALNLGSERA
ncbi:glycine--tRNA ligase subunit alpha [Candidatus Hodgkinia cicadicola]